MEERKIKKDLTGQKFGRLLVINRAEDEIRYDKRYKNGISYITMWNCECECGNTCIVSTTRLLKGLTRSCGCLRKETTSTVFTKNLVGEKFGDLTVIEYKGSKKGRSLWLCECKCGNKILCTQHELTQENKKDCGCERINRIINKRNKNKYIVHADYIEGIDANGKIFYIDKEDFNLIKDYTWIVSDKGYVYTCSFGKHISMHSLILNCVDNKETDHKNRKPWDNRRNNLREATSSQNKFNRKIRPGVSGVIGVRPTQDNKKWRATIFITGDGKETRLGIFTSKEEAIKARLIAEAKYYGDFAPQKHLFEEYGIEVNE